MGQKRAVTLLTLLFGAVVLAAGYYGTFGSRHRVFSVATRPAEISPHILEEGETHYDHSNWEVGEFTVPEDLWITSFSASLKGAPIGIMHNFYLVNDSERDEWCPGNPRYVWAGGTVSGQRGLRFDSSEGIFLKQGEKLRLLAMFHNLAPGGDLAKGTHYSEVSFVVRAEYESADKSSRNQNLELHLVTPGGCDIFRPLFEVPGNAQDAVFSTRERPFVFSRSGAIIRMGAHFHASYEPGVENALRVLLNGELLDEFRSVNIADDDERNPLLLRDKTPHWVTKGDRLWIDAVFNNPSPVPVAEGMAIAAFYFNPHLVRP